MHCIGREIAACTYIPNTHLQRKMLTRTFGMWELNVSFCVTPFFNVESCSVD